MADEVALALRRALRFFPEATKLNLSAVSTRLPWKVFSNNWNTGGILGQFYARLYTLRNLYAAPSYYTCAVVGIMIQLSQH